MEIYFNSFALHTELYKCNAASKYIFLLHGFSGSGKDWKAVAEELKSNFNVVTIDLIGHGQSEAPLNISYYTCPALVTQIFTVIKSYTDDKIFLCGYSMGGRAALSFAVHFNNLIEGLILESCSPGLQTTEERNIRLARDKAVADFIINHSLEEFADYWMNLDIFNTQKRFSNEKLDEIKQVKISNNKTGLSNSLLGFSSGMMPSFWDNLKNISTNTLLITGELDSKYSEINSKMLNLFPSAVHRQIKAAGHNTHLEEPSLFLSEIKLFLNKFLNS